MLGKPEGPAARCPAAVSEASDGLLFTNQSALRRPSPRPQHSLAPTSTPMS